jgi:mono/diheme cytochrome c family protein
MKKFAVLAVLFVLPFVLIATSQGEEAKGDATNGKALYAKGCAKCHGANGVGNPGLAKALHVEIRPLSDPEVQAKSDEQLAKESIEGVGKMKAVAGMTVAKEGADIVAYIRSLKK